MLFEATVHRQDVFGGRRRAREGEAQGIKPVYEEIGRRGIVEKERKR